MKPTIEQLEPRTLLASSFLMGGGALLIIADYGGDSVVLSQPRANVVEVYDAQDTLRQDFTGITSIKFRGSIDGDNLYNNTNIPLTAQAYNKTYSNTVFVGGSSGLDVLDGSQSGGNFYATLTASGTEIGGKGFNNLFALGGTHSLITGSGTNAVYSIIGADSINAQNGTGYLLVGAKASVIANSSYQIVTFFQPLFAQQTTSFFFQKDVNGNGILYLLPQNTTSVNYVINKTGNQITVTYSDGSGTQQNASFDKKSIQWLAFFSVVGTSQLTNNTNINNVFYAKANSVLVGGFGKNVLKLHTGPGMAVGRGTYNDLFSGPGGSSTLVGAGKNNVFRNNAAVINTIDMNVHRDDVVINVPAFINGIYSNNQNLMAMNMDFFTMLMLRKRDLL